MSREAIYVEISAERGRQEELFPGEFALIPIVSEAVTRRVVCPLYGVSPEEEARVRSKAAFARGEGTIAHILVEELAEVLEAAAQNDALARTELVQLAACCVAAIEAIDAKKKTP